MKACFCALFAIGILAGVQCGWAGQRLHENVVATGFWESMPKATESEMEAMEKKLESTPGMATPDLERDVASLLNHVNKRLKTEGVAVRVVLETNMSGARTKEVFLDKIATRLWDREFSDAEFAKMSCRDLVTVIVEKTGLSTLYRKGCVVLINYVSAE